MSMSGSFLPSLGRQQPQFTRVEGADIVMKSSDSALAVSRLHRFAPGPRRVFRQMIWYPPRPGSENETDGSADAHYLPANPCTGLPARRPMLITKMRSRECREMVTRLGYGRLACASNNRPYIVPLYFSY